MVHIVAKRPFLFHVDGVFLRPFDVDTETRLEQFGQGQLVRCVNLTKPRTLPFQGYYWATLTQIVEATECAATADHLHDFLVKACNYTSLICDATGKPIDMVRDSTAFDAMDELAFETYVMAAQKVLAERLQIVWDDYTRTSNYTQEQEAAA